MIAIRTSLARHVPAQPLDDDEIAAKAGAAWRERGWVCIRIDDAPADQDGQRGVGNLWPALRAALPIVLRMMPASTPVVVGRPSTVRRSGVGRPSHPPGFWRRTSVEPPSQCASVGPPYPQCADRRAWCATIGSIGRKALH